MALPKVTGVVWWEMQVSHYKALFRRARHNETERGYTKDFLQGPGRISDALRQMFGGREPPYEPLRYRWPGDSFPGGRIYKAADYDQNRRVEVGQWTEAGAPAPWRIGDPATDPLVTLEGNPEAQIPDAADAQWEVLQEFEPWLVMVQLDGDQSELHLRAYLGAPPAHLLDAGLERVPVELRQQMRGRRGLVAGEGLPDLWFDAENLRDPWNASAESAATETPAATPPPAAPLGTDYRPANESVTSATPEPFEVDPDERDRGTQAHALTQNTLSEAVRGRGHEPRSPTSNEPNYDVAWNEAEDTLVVAEVKSVSPKNSEKQLRLALGQVLRYRDLLETPGRTVRSVIALSSPPHDQRWTELCRKYDIGLIWMPDIGSMLGDWLD